MAQVQESAAFDSSDAFALRIKYQKHVLFVPVEPSTSYETLVSRSLSILAKSDAIPPEDSGFASFDEIKEEDAALFQGSLGAAGGSTQQSLRYIQIDRRKEDTISKMGFKDGPEAVAYLGFRKRGKSGYQNPIVTIPSLIEDEEEEDPDAIPPPLNDDSDTNMLEPSKGKRRA